jgi:hypothetical protein
MSMGTGDQEAAVAGAGREGVKGTTAAICNRSRLFM